MGTTIDTHTLGGRLDRHELHKQFTAHEFFRYVDRGTVTVQKAAVIVGQWWHPLHYFPTFLARCIAVTPDIESKSAIARILAQEVGCGNPRRAHEVIYIDSMQHAGFAREQITLSTPFEETAALIATYERSSAARFPALGSIFATEVTDLLMVSAIGRAVSGATGVQRLEWVDIHVEQEPDHVEEATHVVPDSFSAADESLVLASAEEMWRSWIGFFDRLHENISAASPRKAVGV